jgi:phospholipase D1/2
VRSVANWSIGIKSCDASIRDAYVDMINNAKHYIYIENQFFITQCRGKCSNQNDVLNSIGEALYWRIIRAFRDQETFRVYVLFPLLPAFPGIT